MPKNRKLVKFGQNNELSRKVRPAHKLRIGTRRAGTSALLMSNKELQDVISNSDKCRYHSRAKRVLIMRGILI